MKKFYTRRKHVARWNPDAMQLSCKLNDMKPVYSLVLPFIWSAAGTFNYGVHEFQILLYFKRFLRLRHLDQIDQGVSKQELLLFVGILAKTFHHVVHDKVCLLHFDFTGVRN